MTLKEIFRPTKGKIILAFILYLILSFLFVASMVQVTCIEPPCKNQLLETIGIALNIVPVLFLWGIASLLPSRAVPFPIDFILAIFAYFVVPVLWAYFLSCVIIFLYGLISKKKNLSHNELS